MTSAKKIAKNKKMLEGTHTPLEKKVLSADLVRVTTVAGTTLIGEVSYIDRYHIEIGNVVVQKHAIEMYELDPVLEDDEDEDTGSD